MSEKTKLFEVNGFSFALPCFAFQVMATVRDLCSEGHTVLVAIHQPRSSIYAMFDDLLLLSDGQVRSREKRFIRILSRQVGPW